MPITIFPNSEDNIYTKNYETITGTNTTIDFNSYTNSSIYILNVINPQFLNGPTGFSSTNGILEIDNYDTGAGSGVLMQKLYSPDKNEIYRRMYTTEWSGWTISEVEETTTVSTSIDLNHADKSSTIFIDAPTTQIVNGPLDLSSANTEYILDQTVHKNKNYKYQILISVRNNDKWERSHIDGIGWNNWEKTVNVADLDSANYLPIVNTTSQGQVDFNTYTSIGIYKIPNIPKLNGPPTLTGQKSVLEVKEMEEYIIQILYDPSVYKKYIRYKTNNIWHGWEEEVVKGDLLPLDNSINTANININTLNSAISILESNIELCLPITDHTNKGSESIDFNNYIQSGLYRIGSTGIRLNGPSDVNGTRLILEVALFDGANVVQTLHDILNTKKYIRYKEGNVWKNWLLELNSEHYNYLDGAINTSNGRIANTEQSIISLNNAINTSNGRITNTEQSITSLQSDINTKMPIVLISGQNDINLNDYIETGIYIIFTTNNANLPGNGSYENILEVKAYNGTYLVQILHRLFSATTFKRYKTYNHSNNDGWKNWEVQIDLNSIPYQYISNNMDSDINLDTFVYMGYHRLIKNGYVIFNAPPFSGDELTIEVEKHRNSQTVKQKLWDSHWGYEYTRNKSFIIGDNINTHWSPWYRNIEEIAGILNIIDFNNVYDRTLIVYLDMDASRSDLFINGPDASGRSKFILYQLVFHRSDHHRYQTLISTSDNKTWYRSYHNHTWSSWNITVTENEVDSKIAVVASTANAAVSTANAAVSIANAAAAAANINIVTIGGDVDFNHINTKTNIVNATNLWNSPWDALRQYANRANTYIIDIDIVGTDVKQTLTDLTTSKMWFRCKNGSNDSWSKWKKIDSANKELISNLNIDLDTLWEEGKFICENCTLTSGPAQMSSAHDFLLEVEENPTADLTYYQQTITKFTSIDVTKFTRSRYSGVIGSGNSQWKQIY